MKYRIVVSQNLDVPKNVFVETFLGTKEEAVERAKLLLMATDGDVVIVVEVEGGDSKLLYRFEKVKKAS